MGYKYDQYLDRSILVMMCLLRGKLKAKTRDLLCKSLVSDSASDEFNTVEYIALCVDTAEREYKKLSDQANL